MRSYSPREVIKILLQNGWKLTGTRGSHYMFSKKEEAKFVTVSISKKTVPIGTLKNIETQTDIKFE